MTDAYRVNEKRAVQTMRVGNEQNPVIVIDDLLVDPRTLVEFAATAARFLMPKNWYPGLRAEPLPQPYVIALIQALHPIIGEVFGLPTAGGVNTNTYFGLATTLPSALSPLQRLPHFDAPNPRQVALLHYLCDSAHGGTSFYRHRATGFESIDEARQKPYFDRLNAELASGPPPARYVSGDSDLYEETARIEARFNRLVIYRSRTLHSANVNAAQGLSSDPRAGRLTANVFLAYR